jgi:biopolymer transport protein TolR
LINSVDIENLETELKALQEKDPEINLQLQAILAAVFESMAKVMQASNVFGIVKQLLVTMQE